MASLPRHLAVCFEGSTARETGQKGRSPDPSGDDASSRARGSRHAADGGAAGVAVAAADPHDGVGERTVPGQRDGMHAATPTVLLA